MSAAIWLAVGILGGLGAVARYLVDGAVLRRLGAAFPAGILVVNLSGAFLLGLLTGAGIDGDARLLLGAGLLGAYTTFSTWVYDSERLRGEGRGRAAAVNIAGSLVLGLAAVWLGRELGASLL